MTAILCAGVLCVDVVVGVVDVLPPPGDILFPETATVTGGGSAYNTGIGLAHFGCSVTLGGRIGRDPLGAVLRSELEACQVGTSALQSDPHRPTGLSVVLVSPGGERSFLHHPGANAALCSADLEPHLTQVSWLHIGGAGVLAQLTGAELTHLLRRARELGLPTSMDTATGPSVAMMDLHGALPYLDLCFVNHLEGTLVTGCQNPNAIATGLVDLGARYACVKLGGDGAVLVNSKHRVVSCAALPVRAVDTTGAGDAFVAGFLSVWTAGGSPEEALHGGAAAGAACVQHWGGTSWCVHKDPVPGTSDTVGKEELHP